MVKENHPFLIYIAGADNEIDWRNGMFFLHRGGVSKDNLKLVSSMVPEKYDSSANSRIDSFKEVYVTKSGLLKLNYFFKNLSKDSSLNEMIELYKMVSQPDFKDHIYTNTSDDGLSFNFRTFKMIFSKHAKELFSKDAKGSKKVQYDFSESIRETQKYSAKFFCLFRNNNGILLENMCGKYLFHRKDKLIKLDYKRYECHYYSELTVADILLNNPQMKVIEKIVMEPDLKKFDVVKVEGLECFNSWHGFRAVNLLEQAGEEIYHNINIEDALKIFDNQDSVNAECPGLMMILNHLRYVMCSDKREQYVELLMHIASLIQKPTRQLPVCIFKSDQGVGKNLIFEQLLGDMILGDEYSICTEKIDLAVGRFNSILESKTFLILDETSTFIGDHHVNNLLKSLATQKKINIERKGMDAYKVPSYINKMIFTNNEAPLKIEATDRRYNVYDVDNRVINEFDQLPECVRGEFTNKKDYFAKMAEYVPEESVVLAVTRFFCSIDVRGYLPTVFSSVTKGELREMSKTPFELFCEALEGKSLVDSVDSLDTYYENGERIVRAALMSDLYVSFCNVIGSKKIENHQVFLMKLMKRFKFGKKRLRRNGLNTYFLYHLEDQAP